MNDFPEQFEPGPSGSPQVTPAFLDALRIACGSDVPADPGIDDTVLRAAKLRFESTVTKRRRTLWMRSSAAAAVIAGVCLTGWLLNTGQTRHKPSTSEHIAREPMLAPNSGSGSDIANDWTGDGRVDILDAFGLARSVQARHLIDARWDINHDGRVDQLDADSIASIVVQLSEARGT